MSIVIPGEQTWMFVRREAVDEVCFLCGEVVSEHEIAVMWAGVVTRCDSSEPQASEIWFHAECSTSFVLRLARDAWEVQHAAR